MWLCDILQFTEVWLQSFPDDGGCTSGANYIQRLLEDHQQYAQIDDTDTVEYETKVYSALS